MYINDLSWFNGKPVLTDGISAVTKSFPAYTHKMISTMLIFIA